MTLEQLIKQRIERLDSVPDNMLSAIDRQQQRAFEKMLVELSKLEQVDGKIIASKKNYDKVQDILSELQKTFVGKDYVSALQSFATEIKTQSTINNSILSKVVEDFSDSATYKANVKNAQRNALLLIDENSVQGRFIQPLSAILNNSITTENNFTKTVESLRNSMVGDNAPFRKYAGTYVKDAFAVADRQYVQLTANDYGIVFYKYSGGHVRDTRIFCDERYGQVFHVDEIRAWGANKNTEPEKFQRPAESPVYTNPNGIKLYWEGENYDTNSQTILSYCGGYTCNHVLVPVAIKYVPQADKDRAQRLGYYKP